MKTAIIAAIAILTASTASAEKFTWKETERWEIVGRTDIGYCIAQTRYPSTGAVLQINAGRDGFSLAFLHPASKQLVPGKIYNLPVKSDTGGTGTFRGKAITENMISIDNVTYQSIVNLAKARWLQINNFGRFNLVGSAEAIAYLIECVEFANGI